MSPSLRERTLEGGGGGCGDSVNEQSTPLSGGRERRERRGREEREKRREREREREEREGGERGNEVHK